jgi:hypothetical protein
MYPAIAILDENQNQIYNNYLENYLHMLGVLNKIDKLAEKITLVQTNEYKITKTIILTMDNKKYITDEFQVYYNYYKNDYWLVDAKKKVY